MADNASEKKTLQEVMTILEKANGKVHVLPDEPPLDQAVYLILRENWDYRKATKVLHDLQRDYVDWNEIRVTTAGEMRGVLAPYGDRDVDVKIEKLRTLLDNLYKEFNTCDLGFLKEMEMDQQRRYLSTLGVLTPAQVQILVQTMQPSLEEFEVPQQAVRVLTRIGIMPRVYSASSARKHVEKLSDELDVYAFQAHLVQHGEDVCLNKSPHCGECSLVALCGFKRKVGVVGKAS